MVSGQNEGGSEGKLTLFCRFKIRRSTASGGLQEITHVSHASLREPKSIHAIRRRLLT
jgi:hypothetical protein